MIKNDNLISPKHNHIKTIPTFGIPIICKTPELREKYIARFSDANIEIRPIISGNMQKQPFYKKYIKDIFETSPVCVALKISNVFNFFAVIPRFEVFSESDSIRMDSCVLSWGFIL